MALAVSFLLASQPVYINASHHNVRDEMDTNWSLGIALRKSEIRRLFWKTDYVAKLMPHCFPRPGSFVNVSPSRYCAALESELDIAWKKDLDATHRYIHLQGVLSWLDRCAYQVNHCAAHERVDRSLVKQQHATMRNRIRLASDS